MEEGNDYDDDDVDVDAMIACLWCLEIPWMGCHHANLHHFGTSYYLIGLDWIVDDDADEDDDDVDAMVRVEDGKNDDDKKDKDWAGMS